MAEAAARSSGREGLPDLTRSGVIISSLTYVASKDKKPATPDLRWAAVRKCLRRFDIEDAPSVFLQLQSEAAGHIITIGRKMKKELPVSDGAGFDAPRIEKFGFLIAGLMALVGAVFAWHDALLVLACVLAANLLLARRSWRARLLAALLIASGLFWSYSDAAGCSAFWRGAALYAKLTGRLPFVPWPQVRSFALEACSESNQPHSEEARQMQWQGERTFQDRKCEQFQTPLGSFWVGAPGKNLMAGLLWEQMRQHVYDGGAASVQPGDIVFDCGAHVGLFTRYALRRGAARVIAIEPDAINLACLRANLASEIAAGQVTVIEGGVWNSRTVLNLRENIEGNSAGGTFVGGSAHGRRPQSITVMPLDEIVNELHLSRVDFIKMDIEGSERFALQGASKTLSAFRPRLAISSYHLRGDEEEILAIVTGAQSGYRVHAKDIEAEDRWVRTKVLFFD